MVDNAADTVTRPLDKDKDQSLDPAELRKIRQQRFGISPPRFDPPDIISDTEEPAGANRNDSGDEEELKDIGSLNKEAL